MYEVRVKGRNLSELTKAVGDIYAELSNGKFSGNVSKNLVDVKEVQVATIAPVVEEVETVVEEVAAPVQHVESFDANSVDVEGFKWDKRIHASSKLKTNKGVWKLKKGVEKNLVYQVYTEQKSQANSVVAEVPALPTSTPVTTPVVTAPVVTAPVVNTAPPMPTMNTGYTLENFIANFPMVIGSLITKQTLNEAYIAQLKDYFGVKEIWLTTDAQKTEIFNNFVAGGLIQKVG